jgi:hypothetical protein
MDIKASVFSLEKEPCAFDHLIKTLFIICVLMTVALQFNTLNCQETDSVFFYKLQYDSLYGLDPNLYNGIKYSTDHTLARGFPFWKEDKAIMADIVLAGKYYKNLNIKYDLYNQEFILEYLDQFGGLQQLIINRLKIDTVFVNNNLFIKNKFDEINVFFIQIIYEGKISCYNTLKKEYRFINSGILVGHEYSNEIIHQYLVREGKVFVFNNKSNFLKIFEPDQREPIRKYIKSNRIKLRRKIQTDLVNLCEFCSKLYSE